jgi:predicted metal-binding membrane protein
MVYSKTRLGADQLDGGPRLSRRGKLIVFSVLGVVLAAAVSLGIWSAVGSDQYSKSANGCVNFNIPNTMGGALIHYCGSQAVVYCRSAYASSDKLSLLGRPQCELAGLTRAKVAAG